MGIYIKGIEKPTKCAECYFYDQELGCMLVDDDIDHRSCPLVEVPTPHGRLIDADAVKKAVFHHLSIKGEEYLLPAEKSVFGNIVKSPTVIEAEEE